MRRLYKKYPSLKLIEENGKHRLNVRKAVLKHAPLDGIGAEIGVFTGLFSEVLFEEIACKKLYLVDPWRKLHGESYPNWGSYTSYEHLPTVAAKEAAEVRAADALCECEVVEDFGSNWLSAFEYPFLDWVYLDAKHTYASVWFDLCTIMQCLLPHGVILGDDMWVHRDTRNSDVYFAVRDFCRTKGFDIIHLDHHGQWAIKRRCDIDRFGVPKQKDPDYEN